MSCRVPPPRIQQARIQNLLLSIFAVVPEVLKVGYKDAGISGVMLKNVPIPSSVNADRIFHIKKHVIRVAVVLSNYRHQTR
jgi:hypothetical protein